MYIACQSNASLIHIPILIFFAVVSERLVSRGYYEVMGKMLKVSLFKKEPDPLEKLLADVNPGNTLVLSNVPSDIKEDQLLMFLELTCGLKEGDFHLHHLKTSPLVLMTLMDSMKGEYLLSLFLEFHRYHHDDLENKYYILGNSLKGTKYGCKIGGWKVCLCIVEQFNACNIYNHINFIFTL